MFEFLLGLTLSMTFVSELFYSKILFQWQHFFQGPKYHDSWSKGLQRVLKVGGHYQKEYQVQDIFY